MNSTEILFTAFEIPMTIGTTVSVLENLTAVSIYPFLYINYCNLQGVNGM